MPLDGSSPKNLTNGVGTKNDIRFRYARVEPIDPTVPRAVGPRGTIDLSKPIMLTAYGQWTKKSGFYELKGGELKELVYDDASFSAPEKAAKADRFLFTRQTFIEFPDLRVSGPASTDAKKITDANPQQKDYMWGRRILFDYKNKDGVRLQGILALPDDYKEGEKRPMLVTFYEKNSQNLHRYNAPSYLTGMGGSPMEAVSRGYLTMLPDIHYRTGNSHSDQLEGVEAATRKVIEMGYADPKRIGVTGHSYGGEGAAFIGTQSKMFAAVGMGAGVTDLFNDFAQPLGLVVPGERGQRRHRVRLLPLRPGPLGLLTVGQPREVPLRVRARPREQGHRAVPDHARHRGSDRRLRERPRVLQRAPLQRQEGGPARVSERRPRPARHGEPEGPDDAVLPVLRSLPEGRAGAEVAHGRRAVFEEEREAVKKLSAISCQLVRLPASSVRATCDVRCAIVRALPSWS